MATMKEPIRLVFLGQSGAGKSRLINLLKEFDSQKDGEPNEGIKSEAERTYGCRYLHTRIDHKGENYNLRIVDTPGFFQEGVTKATKNWRDMAEAVHKSGMAVNVFVIVLKASDVIKSEEVLQSFVEFFGAIAALNSVVVFTDSEYSATEREVSFFHGKYLTRYMREGYLKLLWKNNDNESSCFKLMGFVTETYGQKPYKAKHFSEAQMKYTKNWMMSLQKAKVRVGKLSCSSNDELLVSIGIPDVLVINFLTEKQKAQLVKCIKNKVR